MSGAGWLQVVVLLAAVAVGTRLLGAYLAAVFGDDERAIDDNGRARPWGCVGLRGEAAEYHRSRTAEYKGSGHSQGKGQSELLEHWGRVQSSSPVFGG